MRLFTMSAAAKSFVFKNSQDDLRHTADEHVSTKSVHDPSVQHLPEGFFSLKASAHEWDSGFIIHCPKELLEVEREHCSINSIIGKCEKAILKLNEGTSQYTLTKRQIEAFYIAVSLIERELKGEG